MARSVEVNTCLSDSDVLTLNSKSDFHFEMLKEKALDDLQTETFKVHYMYIGPYIVETLNNTLPTSPKDRKKSAG